MAGPEASGNRLRARVTRVFTPVRRAAGKALGAVADVLVPPLSLGCQ